jgi:uncharacterized protein Usg
MMNTEIVLVTSCIALLETHVINEYSYDVCFPSLFFLYFTYWDVTLSGSLNSLTAALARGSFQHLFLYAT